MPRANQLVWSPDGLPIYEDSSATISRDQVADHGIIAGLQLAWFTVYVGLEPPHVFADPHGPAPESACIDQMARALCHRNLFAHV